MTRTIRRVGRTSAIAATLALMVLAMWWWSLPVSQFASANRPEVARWAARSAAVAVASGAQLLLLGVVIGGLASRDFRRDVPRLVFGVVGCVALVSAVALGLASY
ncbi:MAG: hypothetical protein ACREJC_05040 [Tepidisphaeraceae bacterium]